MSENKAKEVVISISTLHDMDSGDNEGLNFITDGLYSFDGQNGYIRYYETEITGMPGTRTDLVISPDSVIVDRQGMVTSRMEFREGGRTSFMYNTPYGTATLGLKTGKVCADMNKDGGRTDIDYVLSMTGAVTLRNRFSIEVRKQ